MPVPLLLPPETLHLICTFLPEQPPSPLYALTLTCRAFYGMANEFLYKTVRVNSHEAISLLQSTLNSNGDLAAMVKVMKVTGDGWSTYDQETIQDLVRLAKNVVELHLQWSCLNSSFWDYLCEYTQVGGLTLDSGVLEGPDPLSLPAKSLPPAPQTSNLQYLSLKNTAFKSVLPEHCFSGLKSFSMIYSWCAPNPLIVVEILMMVPTSLKTLRILFGSCKNARHPTFELTTMYAWRWKVNMQNIEELEYLVSEWSDRDTLFSLLQAKRSLRAIGLYIKADTPSWEESMCIWLQKQFSLPNTFLSSVKTATIYHTQTESVDQETTMLRERVKAEWKDLYGIEMKLVGGDYESRILQDDSWGLS